MGTDQPAVVIRGFRDDEVSAAAAVLARGMRDNPGHVAAFGDDPDQRQRSLRRLFTATSARLPSMPTSRGVESAQR